MTVSKPEGFGFEDSAEEVHSIETLFRVGSSNDSIDYYKGNERIYAWERNGDVDFAEIAGWADMIDHLDETTGFIKVPKGTRNSTSVLSGMEAWVGEKEDVIRYIANYQAKVVEKFGRIDTSVGLDSVGVTKERHMFVVPPHHTALSKVEEVNWLDDIHTDLNQVLRTEPSRQQLVDKFISKLQEIQDLRRND